MSTLITILVTVLIFGIIIFIHELGHFTLAKLSKIKVNEFAMGMGPVLFRKRRKETNYSIRAFPIGGFVSMEGEDESSESSDAFYKKPWYKRACVLLAGAFMNLLLGFVLLVIITSSSKYQIPGMNVVNFKENASSKQTGLQEGDRIISIDSSPVFVADDIVYELFKTETGIVDIGVIRDGKKVMLEDVTFKITEKTGEKNEINIDFQVAVMDKTPFSVMHHSFNKTLSFIKMVWGSMVDIITGKIGVNQLSGPVGVANVVGEAVSEEVIASRGFEPLLTLAAFITINVGVFNLLPFPALDGGRMIFLLIELIIRRPVKKEIEGYINIVGFGLLMILMVFVTTKDIFNLF